MLTKDEAKCAVEAKLRSLKLSGPMSEVDMTLFCSDMYKEILFRSKSDRMQDIRAWAERWQLMNFR